MTTKFAIVDVGSMVIGTITGKAITIENAGGTPAAEILNGMRHFSDKRKLASAMLRRWIAGGGGYEGGLKAARENSLYVSIDNDEVREYA